MFLSTNQTDGCCDDDDLLANSVLFIQNLLLIISNFFLLPAIYLALRCKYHAEAIIYFLTMLCSSFYHLCDNGAFQYCVFRFEVLQFCDFFSAILTMWSTAVLMSDLPYEWRSVLHLTGSLFFAGLLRSQTAGFWSFVVPGFSSFALLSSSWAYQYFYKNMIPSSVAYMNLVPGAILSLVGAILFASQTTKYVQFYDYTHSGWHICMSLAIAFLLPKTLTNQISFKDYSDRICVLSVGTPEV